MFSSSQVFFLFKAILDFLSLSAQMHAMALLLITPTPLNAIRNAANGRDEKSDVILF